jgi:hypothetical protein
MAEFSDFVRDSRDVAAGWIGFYWGTPPAELRRSHEIADQLMWSWLEFFQANRAETGAAARSQILP